MTKIQRIAIITGVQEEADAFLTGSETANRNSPLGSVRQLNHANREIEVICSGIGKVHAAAAAMYLNHSFEPDLFMIIGTAGQVSNIDGHCFYLQQSLQADYGTLEDSANNDGFTHYNAGAWPIGPSDWAPFEALPMPETLALPNARIATADSFVKCPERSGYLRDTLNVDLVDMETAAVAQVAKLLAKPWAGIKATTDKADGNSSGDFHANLEAAAQRAANAAVRLIELL